MKFPLPVCFVIVLCPMGLDDKSVRIDAYRCASVESENILSGLDPEIWDIIIGGVRMFCLAIVRQDDRNVFFGQDIISQNTGQYMYKYLIAGSYSSKICEEPR